MTAFALRWPTINRAVALRGIAAGAAWGVAVASTLLGLSFYQCNSICLGQIVEMTALSVAAGIVAIGPLVVLRRGDAAASQ